MPPAGSPFGIVARATVGATGEAVAFAFGLSVAPLLAPVLEEIRHAAWEEHASKLPGADLLAEGVSTRQIDPALAAEWAKKSGIDGPVFDALVAIADKGPGLARAFELRRRGEIDDDGLHKAITREGIEEEWIPHLMRLSRVLLSPAELANAVVQGHRSFEDALPDAERQGLNQAGFQTVVDNTGLPPGPETLLDWRRRGIFTSDEQVAEGIREGHTKVKYIDEYLKALKRVLSAPEYAGLRLRGWLTEDEAAAGGALTGYDADQMELLYLNRGRPATTRQVHIGWARGGRLDGAGDERAAFSQAVKQSNIRPEYEELLWAQRYSYPSAFVLRGLAEAGDLTEAETLDALLFNGWEPTLAAKVAAKWAGGDGAGKSAKWADRARSSLFTVTKREYLDESIDRAGAEASLDVVGVPEGERAAIFAAWDRENATGRKELTTAQIKAAYKAGGLTQDEALGRLVDAGVTLADAELILNPAGA